MRKYVLAFVLAWPGIALAQTTPDEVTAAAQFDRGLSEMKAGHYDVACPALAESERLDPRPGTLFTLAECESRAGRIATAVAHYEDYIARFAKMTPDQKRGQHGREAIAAEQVSTLKPSIPMITVNLPGDSSQSGVTVLRNDVPLGRASIGVALPIDPGTYTYVVQTADGRTEAHVTIGPREQKSVDLVVPIAKVHPIVPVEPVQQPVQLHEARSGSHVGVTIAALGVGLAGVALGSIMGAFTIGEKGTIDASCDANFVCNATGKGAADNAQAFGLVSTISFGVGAAALVATIILFVTEPRHAKTVALAPGGFSWKW